MDFYSQNMDFSFNVFLLHPRAPHRVRTTYSVILSKAKNLVLEAVTKPQILRSRSG